VKFEWDKRKEAENLVKHGVDFETAKEAFRDARRVILHDEKHSQSEPRLFCMGIVGGRVLTVRFTLRDKAIRIIGAGYWREGKSIYEKNNED
jgi:hypothetical protein